MAVSTNVRNFGIIIKLFGVLKVARTIADLAGDADIGTPNISEAIQYRMMERMR